MRKIILPFIALLAIGFGAAFGANYAVTQGSGTTFGSLVVSAVNYAQQLTCDPTTPSQCGAVTATGGQIVDVATSNNQLHTDLTAPIPAQSVAVPIGGHGICDGANGATNPCTTVATVKAASTPAAATDKALVVDQRPGTTVSANTAQVNGVTTLTGTGATGTGAQRVTVSTDQATNAGAALVKGGVGVVNGGSTYQAVAASQTATVLQSSTGAIGDYLSHCDIYPTSTSPGVVTVFDNTNAAAGSAILFPGGASSITNLVPFAIPVGAVSTAGAWKVTTGANVSVVCFGKFS